jgi:hypothetical protein
MNYSWYDAYASDMRLQNKWKRPLVFLIFLFTITFLSGMVAPQALFAAPGDITTIAGGGVGDSGSALSAGLYLPRGIHVTASGVIYIADTLNHRVRKVDANGIITTVAGNGKPGFSGDGGLATSARLKYPMAVAVDHAGNIYIADGHNDRVRKMDTNGIISTVIGGGTENAGNYCSLSAADVGNIFPKDIFIDSSDRVYITDGQLWRLETNGTLINLSDSSCGYGSLDPGFSSGFFDASGAFIYASGNNIFRTTDMRTSTLLGAFSDVSPGALTALSGDASGNIYVASLLSNTVYRFDPTGTSTIFAGTRTAGYSGDGGSAASANINNPTDVSVDAAGNVYMADRMNHRIRKVDLNGTITTVVGTGEAGYAGAGLAATSGRLNLPRGVYADSAGNAYIADTYNHRVRKVDASGIMTTIAGNGAADFSGDGGPASAASLSYPTGIFVASDGSVYIADSFNDRIRRVDPTGTITTIAGTEDTGYAGDGGLATEAVLNYPTGVIVDDSGNVFIADYGSSAIRKIDTSGVISTYANIVSPRSIALDSSGVLYVATNYDGINRVYPNGTVDLMPSCIDAVGVSVDSAGRVYMACQSDHTIQAATPGIKPGRVAGTWDEGFSGDGGPASEAVLSSPSSVFAAASGALYIADSGNNRVRKIEPGFEIVPIPPSVKILYPSEGEVTNRRTLPLWYTVSSGTVVVKVDGIVVNIVSGGTLGPLADGQHTIRVEATDSIGTGFAEETLTVDTVAPIISIVSPQSGLTSNDHPLLVYSVNEAVSYVMVRLDGSYLWINSGDSLGTLSEGTHSLVIEATDIAGNTGTAVVNFTISSMPPTVTIISPATGITNNSTPLLSYTANTGTVVVKVDGITVSKVSGNTLDSLVDGPHTIRVEATDSNSTGFAERAFTVDTTEPTVSIVSPSAGAANSNQPVLTYTTSDGTVVVKVDGVVVPKVSGNTLDILAEGSHTVRVESTDGAGNTGYAEVIFIVDTGPPTVGINPVATPTNMSAQTISGTRENGAVIVVALNTTAIAGAISYPTGTSWSCTISGLVEGANNITVTAADAVGNNAAATTSITCDAVAPTVTISSPSAGNMNNNRPLLTYTASDGAVIVKVDGNIVQKISGNTLDALTDGLHAVRVESTDAAGNLGFAEATFTVDTASPTVTINSPASATMRNNAPLLSYTVSDGAVIVRVDGAVVPKVSGNTLGPLADGSHTVRVEASDAAGNTGFAQATFTVDTVLPSVSINTVTTPTNVSNQTITGTREENAAVSVVVNTSASVGAVSYPSTATWSCTVSNLSTGSNTVTVTATDAAGNSASAAASISLDSTAPTVSITSPGSAPTNDNTPLLSYSTSDGSVVVKVDSVVVSKVSGDSLNTLTDGSHIVRVESTDAAGNIGSAQVSFIIDTVAPAISIKPVTTPTRNSSQTISGTRESGATVTVTVNTAATAGPISYGSDTTWSCTISSLVRGSNVITARGVDAAGNAATATTTITKK